MPTAGPSSIAGTTLGAEYVLTRDKLPRQGALVNRKRQAPVVVDNLPHANFKGDDAQLDAVIRYLQEEIRKKPVVVPPAPAYPDKSGTRSTASARQ